MRSIAALVYSRSQAPDLIFKRTLEICRAYDLSVAGVVQRNASETDRRTCDASLCNLQDGTWVEILEDRGPAARGCRLDHEALTRIATEVLKSIDSSIGLLMLNKFGRAEVEGGGMRAAITAAVLHGIPVIVGVPMINVRPWREFVCDLAVELRPTVDDMEQWLCENVIPGRPAVTAARARSALAEVHADSCLP